jgi:hypothetical protein
LTTWVVDATPLIFLSKLDQLDLLRRGADEVLTVPAVMREITVYHDRAAQVLMSAAGDWLRVRVPVSEAALAMLLTQLDAGEAEAIGLAREIRADRIVLDDLDARRYARRLGLPVVGTVGLLLAARLRGDLPALRPELDRLARLGFRISASLFDEVVRAAGEM